MPLPHREPRGQHGPCIETTEAGSGHLVLKRLTRRQTWLEDKDMKLALSRHDDRAGCFLLSLGPVSPSDLTKHDKATSLYLLQSNFWQLHESDSEGKVR